jgi:hypothetical protein
MQVDSDEVVEQIDSLFDYIQGEQMAMRYIAAMESATGAEIALADIEMDHMSDREFGLYFAGLVEGVSRSRVAVRQLTE